MTALTMLLATLPARADATSSEADALLHEARARARHGDYEGVRIVAEEALEIEGDHQRTAQYLMALSWELGGDPSHALAIYESLIDAWPKREVPDDLAFRRAECLGRLGRIAEARRQLKALGKPSDRPELDQLKIEVLQGVWDLGLGKDKKGYKRLAATLGDADPRVGAWYQAYARHAILERALEQAAAHTFTGSDKARAEALQVRASLLEVAANQLVETIRLDEPSFALDGFLELGRAYEALGHDLRDASLHGDRVEAVWTKGTLYYDRGLQLATRSAWSAEPVPTLQAELDALVAEVESLSD